VRELVKIAGVRLPQATQVTSFAEGLHFQQGVDQPTFRPPVSLLIERLQAQYDHMQQLYERASAQATSEDVSNIHKLEVALFRQRSALARLRRAEPFADEIERLSEQLDRAYQATGGSETDETIALADRLDELQKQAGWMSGEFHIILGIGIRSMIARTDDGETIRMVVPGDQVTLLVAPLGRQVSVGDVTPNRGRFSVIDDSRSDVQPIDAEFVYVPFETLQKLNNMGPEYAPVEPAENGQAAATRGVQIRPARASQIHVKIDPAVADDEAGLLRVASEIERRWDKFVLGRPGAVESRGSLTVQTWRQRQAGVIGPIEKQRTLVGLMFSVMYIVVVVIIIVIFYTIVMHKTRDIGVLKAIGASGWGVTRIFLLYGAAVGVVGSAVGVLLGWAFVTNINEVQDFTAQHFGFRPWSRDVFMFERIPSTVDWQATGWIVLAALVSALAGALIPAVIAARMQPVRALRYE
jgi:ABC-type lipoprotein release transport system permease subunit